MRASYRLSHSVLYIALILPCLPGQLTIQLLEEAITMWKWILGLLIVEEPPLGGPG